MIYEVKTDKFTGPLALLLDLIEKRKLFISDISLSKVADDFIEYVKTHEKMPMAETAHFILIASTLLLIKSRSLLPELTLTDEEEKDIKELEMRLKIYQKIRDASVLISPIFGEKIMYQPLKQREREICFTPDKHTNTDTMYESIKRVINLLPKKKLIPEAIVKKVISIEEMIDKLTTRISTDLRTSFKEFSKDHRGEKVNIIVSFLAMLELVKNGLIKVNQERDFDDIHMETNNISVPRYN